MKDFLDTPLADALFGKTRKALIGTLFANPDKAWHLRELARHAGVSPTMLAKEAGALSAAGIVVESADGQRRIIRANRDCPIFGELAGIARKAIVTRPAEPTGSAKTAKGGNGERSAQDIMGTGKRPARKSERLGLSAPYDWSNGAVDDNVLIAHVLERHDFRDVARICANYGTERVRKVMGERISDPSAVATLTRMMRNIEDGMSRVGRVSGVSVA